MKKIILFFSVLLVKSVYLSSELKKPTILITILVRNKAHTLPYFLSLVEQFDYPKNRISLWLRSDHNSDKSLEILRSWIKFVNKKYHTIYTEFEDDDVSYLGEEGVAHWTEKRFTHLMSIREKSLNYARQIWADYYLSLDADVFLTNPNTLNYLISKNLPTIAPMLISEGLYSNFWHGMTENYYYQRTDQYKGIVKRQNISCFNVPMIHSCILIDLNRIQSNFLTYNPKNLNNYEGPHDDIIVFALSAQKNNVPLFLCNEEQFGFIMTPLEPEEDLKDDLEHLLNIKIEALNSGDDLFVNNFLAQYTYSLGAPKESMMFDKIFMINLKRRSDRFFRMKRCFEELGLDVETEEAVDGQLLNESFVSTLKFMPDFKDPYHKRPMKLGEIGCFLSHFNIWNKIVNNNYKVTLVLEDDIRFETYFKFRVQSVMEEVFKIPDWDLVYFGRKLLQNSKEPFVKGSKNLVEVNYSYWTLGYALSLNGAKKLLAAEPLKKLVPVDEYLPILFDKHPNESWKRHYPIRDLKAFSAAPLLIYPTHYTGEKGYISDTEDSVIIPENIILKEDL